MRGVSGRSYREADSASSLDYRAGGHGEVWAQAREAVYHWPTFDYSDWPTHVCSPAREGPVFHSNGLGSFLRLSVS